MSDSASFPKIEKLVVNLPAHFGERTEEMILIDKKMYRIILNDTKFEDMFGNRDFIVCTTEDCKEVHHFNERLLASMCAQRISSGGASFVAIRHDKHESGDNPLILLCAFFNGRMVTLNKINQYLARNSANKY